MRLRLPSVRFTLSAFLVLAFWGNFAMSFENGESRGGVGAGSGDTFGYCWCEKKKGDVVGFWFRCGKAVKKGVFFRGRHFFRGLSLSIDGRYIFSVKEKLFFLAPETGEISVIMKDKFAGLVEGAEVGGVLRVLEYAGVAPGFDKKPWYRVLQFSIKPENLKKNYIYARPVIFAVSVGKKGVVGAFPNSKGDFEIVLSRAAGKDEKELGVVPKEWCEGPISWALPSENPMFLSLAFNKLEPRGVGLLRAFLMVVNLEKLNTFRFFVKYRHPKAGICPGPALAMGWYGGRYLLTSGVGEHWIDALYGKYVGLEKVKKFLERKGEDNKFLGTIGNFLVFKRGIEKKARRNTKRKYVGLFLLQEKGISYADGKKVIIPGDEKLGTVMNCRITISPDGRYALLALEAEKRLWLVDGKKRKVVLLGKNVYDWGWIR